MVEYLSGNRIQGSSTLSSAPPQTSFKFLKRASLSSAGDTITTSTFTAKDNMQILTFGLASGNIEASLQVGNGSIDTGSNYSVRWQVNGTNGTGTGKTSIDTNHTASGNEFITYDIVNVANKEKLVIAELVDSNSAGVNNAPNRVEHVGKWTNTSAQINIVQAKNVGSGSFDTGSEIVVLGCDNDEADTGSNFWQELASGTASGGSLTSGTFTAKKYLMVVTTLNASTNSACSYQFNDDTGANYNTRYNEDGGTDGTWKLTGALPIGRAQGSNSPSYQVSYIVNKSDQEKLTISEDVSNKAGTGSGNAPQRQETVGKWANTSAQITKINIVDSQGISNTPWLAGSTIKVYGAD